MRATALIAAALALGLAGCGPRGHEDVQKDLTKAAEELAAVMASDQSNEAKLQQVEKIAERMKALADEARQLGNPTEREARQIEAECRERDRQAAEKLADAAAPAGASKTPAK